MESLQENHNNLTVPVYLDDLFVVGELQPFKSDLQSSLKNVGLIVNEKKCELFNASDFVQSFGSIPVVSHGTEILGISLATTSLCKLDAPRSLIQVMRALCSELVKLRCPQSATLLLRFCHVTRMNYLARCVSPYSFEYAAKLHDAMTRSTLVQMSGLDSVDDFTRNSSLIKHQIGWVCLI